VHIVQVILAGWNNFQSMVTGWFVVKEKKSALVTVPVVAETTKTGREKIEMQILENEENDEEDIAPVNKNEDEE
jgi:hypothetical protein